MKNVDNVIDAFKMFLYTVANYKITSKLNTLSDYYFFNTLKEESKNIELVTLDKIGIRFSNKDDNINDAIDKYSFNVDLKLCDNVRDLISDRYKYNGCPEQYVGANIYQSILLKLFYSLEDIFIRFDEHMTSDIEVEYHYHDTYTNKSGNGYIKSTYRRKTTQLKRIVTGETICKVKSKIKTIDLYIYLNSLFYCSGLKYLSADDLPGMLNVENNAPYSVFELNFILWLNQYLETPVILLGGVSPMYQLNLEKYKQHYNLLGRSVISQDIRWYKCVDIEDNVDNILYYCHYTNNYLDWMTQIALLMHYRRNGDTIINQILNYVPIFKFTLNTDGLCTRKVISEELTDAFIRQTLGNSTTFNMGSYKHIESKQTLKDKLLDFYRNYYSKLYCNSEE